MRKWIIAVVLLALVPGALIGCRAEAGVGADDKADLPLPR
jgi:hypothetical protein